jgi:4-carboxymuconolactone decarboxylase
VSDADPAAGAALERRAALTELDAPTIALVRLAGAIAGASEREVREAFAAARGAGVPERWVEELVLQSYLFSGFPRTLNAAREWRRIYPETVPAEQAGDAERWRAQGEETCARVYGPMYEKLRHNIDDLHPALDRWMIVEGYGKVLSRPGLDLPRRELCIVAACAASGQDRQLHSHLHGALNVGVAPAVLSASIDALADDLGADRARSVRLLLARVLGK